MDEDAFLKSILDNPLDDAPRLIYADWLDERGQEDAGKKAEVLRLIVRLLFVEKGRKRTLMENRLKRLAGELDSEWLAVVSKLPIEACNQSFKFQCPKKWEALQATDAPTVRHCEACDKEVYYSESLPEAQNHARLGRCVALHITVPRWEDDLIEPYRFETGEFMTAGIMLTDSEPEVPFGKFSDPKME